MKNQSKFTIASLLLLLFLAPLAQASKPVRIATIGASPSINKNQSPEALVEQMISFWQGQLNQVLSSKLDLIVLPEICDVPVGMSTSEQKIYVEAKKNKLSDFFAKIARENNCYIAFGSLHNTDKGLRNSLILLDRAGKIAGTYHKNFPVINEMEQGVIPGDQTTIIKCDFGTVGMAICFDLFISKFLV
jgi:predicted amidohydrolase